MYTGVYFKLSCSFTLQEVQDNLCWRGRSNKLWLGFFPVNGKKLSALKCVWPFGRAAMGDCCVKCIYLGWTLNFSSVSSRWCPHTDLVPQGEPLQFSNCYYNYASVSEMAVAAPTSFFPQSSCVVHAWLHLRMSELRTAKICVWHNGMFGWVGRWVTCALTHSFSYSCLHWLADAGLFTTSVIHSLSPVYSDSFIPSLC